jgi:hypothetical protein
MEKDFINAFCFRRLRVPVFFFAQSLPIQVQKRKRTWGIAI